VTNLSICRPPPCKKGAAVYFEKLLHAHPEKNASYTLHVRNVYFLTRNFVRRVHSATYDALFDTVYIVGYRISVRRVYGAVYGATVSVAHIRVVHGSYTNCIRRRIRIIYGVVYGTTDAVYDS